MKLLLPEITGALIQAYSSDERKLYSWRTIDAEREAIWVNNLIRFWASKVRGINRAEQVPADQLEMMREALECATETVAQLKKDIQSLEKDLGIAREENGLLRKLAGLALLNE